MLVIGAAASGAAAARLGRRLGHAVTVYDQNSRVGSALVGEGIAVMTGRWDPDLLAGIDVMVTSPGVPLRAAPITDAREAGVVVWSEIEFASRHLDAPLLAVTGTNGKTTVTEAAAAMLAASGKATAAVGNIGIPLSTVVGDEYDVIVVEVSSFQLELTEAFHPQTAVLLNIAPDHLDWHPSYPGYVAAKARIFANQVADDLLVYDADDPGVAPVVTRAPGRRHPVSGKTRPAGGSGPAAGSLHLPGLTVPLSSLTSPDPVLVVDLAAAAVAAMDAGAGVDAVAEICRRFRPGSHRREVVAEVNGLRYVDDSKATNPHAALASIESFPSVVLIAGGLDKGLDVAPLARAGNVRFVVAIGAASGRLVDAAGPDRASAAESMDDAVDIATNHAMAGDTILLAPGCASFDMFDDYAARGAAFASAVRSLNRRTPTGGAR
jgi:UDP-N-acetylmuramoylalanine--D-glutamate ligase